MAHVQGPIFILGASHEHHEECKPESDIPCWKAHTQIQNPLSFVTTHFQDYLKLVLFIRYRLMH